MEARSSSWVREQIEHDPEQSGSVKKGSAAASLGVRHADFEQGDRSVHAITEPSLWRTRPERRAKMAGKRANPTKGLTWFRYSGSGSTGVEIDACGWSSRGYFIR
jgi:hypothetical protein